MAKSRSRNASRSAPSATSRLHLLVEWLRSSRPLTTALAAEALGVSRRTVARDLNHLREALCLSVRFDPVQGTYTLDEEHNALPFVPHPDLLPTLLNATFKPPPAPEGQVVHLRFSARSVQAYEATSGIDLSGDVDAEGQLDVYYTPSNPDDLLRWVLSCGAEAEVLAPDDFRCRVQMEIRRMLEVYAPGPETLA